MNSFGEPTLKAISIIEKSDKKRPANSSMSKHRSPRKESGYRPLLDVKEISSRDFSKCLNKSKSLVEVTTIDNDTSNIDKYFENSLTFSKTTISDENVSKSVPILKEHIAENSKRSKTCQDPNYVPEKPMFVQDCPTTSRRSKLDIAIKDGVDCATAADPNLLQSKRRNSCTNTVETAEISTLQKKSNEPVTRTTNEGKSAATPCNNLTKFEEKSDDNSSVNNESNSKVAESLNTSPLLVDIEERCNLSVWGLPPKILQKYESRGLTKMFPWQVECLSNYKVLVENKNLVYSAPTSAGKTLVAELLILKTILERQKKAIFILPFVSVVREKMYYFQDLLSSSGIRVDGFMGQISPPGGLANTQIAIATIEKANSLINRLMEEGGLSSLGAVVVDELHLIGDPSRGYILELLLTKLKYMTLREEHVNIQLIGMSATLPNLSVLAEWLDAELFKTQFRPIPLEERCKINTTVYDSSLVAVRNLIPSPELTNDSDNILQLCIETIADGHSTLIFCPTKNWCESLARQIAEMFYKLGSNDTSLGRILREQLDSNAIAETLLQLKHCPAGLDGVLRSTVSFGVAYHHAGLTMDERDIIEGSFRTGSLRVLVATSTLSSGVNLPARRVIVRSPLFNGKVMDTLSYRQMIGRAGRMGKDTAGESILICKPTEQEAAKSLMSARLNPVKSCLDKSIPLIRALLEAIASEVAYTKADIDLYTQCTFAHFDQTVVLENLTKDAMTYLTNYEFVSEQKLESNESRWVATSLGKACLASSVNPGDGLFIFEQLQRARKSLVLDTDLHIIYLVTPLTYPTPVDWSIFFNLWQSLSESERRVGQLVGVEERFLASALQGISKRGRTHDIHRKFYMALALHDLVHEVPLAVVADKYSYNRGVLQSLQQSASTFAGMVTQFCKQLGWDCLELLFSQFQARLHFGVSRELLDLLRLPAVNGLRARSLFKEGITSIAELAIAEERRVERALHKALPFESERKQEGEQAQDAAKRNQQRSIFVTGKDGLTPYEAAVMLIQEARTFLQREFGVKEVHWEQDNQKSQTSYTRTNNSSKSLLTQKNTIPSENVMHDRTNDEIALDSVKNTSRNLTESKSPADDSSNEQPQKCSNTDIKSNTDDILPNVLNGTSNLDVIGSETQGDAYVTMRFDKDLGISPVGSMDNLEWSSFRKCSKSLDQLQKESFPVLEKSPGVENIPKTDMAAETCSENENDGVVNGGNTPRSSFSRSPSLFGDSCSTDTGCGDVLEKNIDGSLSILETVDQSFGEITRENVALRRSIDNVSPSTIGMKLGKKRIEAGPSTCKDNANIDNSIQQSCYQNAKCFPRSEELDFSWDSGHSWVGQKLCQKLSTNSNVDHDLHVNTIHLSDNDTNSMFNHANLDAGISPSSSRDRSNDSDEDSVFESAGLSARKFNCKSMDTKEIPPESSRRKRKHSDVESAGEQKVALRPSLRSLSNSSRLSLESNNSDDVVAASQHLAISSTTNKTHRSKIKLESIHKIAMIQSSKARKTDKTGKGKQNVTKNINDKSIALIRTDAGNVKKILHYNDCSTSSILSNSGDDSPVQISKTRQSLNKRALSLRNGKNIFDVQTTSRKAKQSAIANEKAESDESIAFDVLDVIDVARNSNLFKLFSVEVAAQKDIAIALANDKFVDEATGIGLKLLSMVDKKKRLKLNETCVHAGKIVNGIAICWGRNVVYYVSFENRNDGDIPLKERLELLRQVLANPSLRVRCHQSKEAYKILHQCCKISANCKFIDPNIAQWLIEPDSKEKSLCEMASIYFPQGASALQHSTSLGNTDNEWLSLNRGEAAAYAFTTWYVMENVMNKLRTCSKLLFDTFYDVETRVISIIARSELSGIGINFESLQDLSVVIQQEMAKLEEQAYALAGRKFSFTSSREVAQALGMYKGKKVSTSKAVLETVENPISKLVMSWRKLNGTQKKMVFPLLNLAQHSPRIHGTCVMNTVTGRISMHEPNMQNVPRDFHSEDETFIFSMRMAFVPNSENVILSADYCQLELRILAHFSEDPVLCEIMRTDCDIFKMIAAQWNNVSEVEISDDIRQRTKQLCYGIIYGMGPRTLATQLKVSEMEAKEFMETFLKTYPNISKWIEQVTNQSREDGYVTTLMERRRMLPGLNSDVGRERSQAQRQAVNTKIQGSAADLVKKAMVLIDDRLHVEFPNAPKVLSEIKTRRLRSSKGSENNGAHLVLHLHDELLYEVNVSDLHQVARIVKQSMEESYRLIIPLPVKIKVGPAWGNLNEYNIPKAIS